jgi:AraC family transcriptional regulator
MSQVVGVAPVSTLPSNGRFGVSAGRWIGKEMGSGIVPPLAEYRLVLNHLPLDRIDIWSDGIKKYSGRSDKNSLRIAAFGESVKSIWTAASVCVSNVFIPISAIKIVTDDLSRRSDHVALRDPLMEIANPIITAIVDELLREGAQYDSLYSDHLTLTLLSTLVKQYAGSNLSHVSTGTLSTSHVRRVTEFMESSLDRDISLTELSGITGLSVFHFARAFKKTTGESAYRYFTSMRIAKAQSLMGNPSQDLTDIALSLGYSSQSAFSTAFRRTTGLSPSAWRKRMIDIN